VATRFKTEDLFRVALFKLRYKTYCNGIRKPKINLLDAFATSIIDSSDDHIDLNDPKISRIYTQWQAEFLPRKNRHK
jgi:hypothetical protein